MSEYVVAGATGRVGSAVAGDLLARGEKVTVILRDPARAGEWQRRGASIAAGSLGDPGFLSRTLQDARGFFVLLPENVPPDEFHAARHEMADVIAAAVKDSGVPHVVMLSAIAASLAEGNGPARALHYLEGRLRTSGTVLTTIRSCYFQDNIAGVLAPARHQGIYPNFFPSADQAFPMVATRDVGRFAAAALAEWPRTTEIVDVFGPAYSVRQLAGKLGAAMGKTLQVVQIPPAEQVAALTGGGVPLQIAEAVVEMLAAFSAGRIVPEGDRSVAGTTTIDEVLSGLLGASGERR